MANLTSHAAPAHSDTADAYDSIPVRKLSPLQEDDNSYYATAILGKSKHRIKVATVAWLKEPFDTWRAKADVDLPKTMAATVQPIYHMPAVTAPAQACTTGDTWTPTFKVVPDARYLHTAVWTGSEMVIWGGYGYVNSGGRYDPATDTWSPTNTANAPLGREYHTAAWTGTEMVVWGGVTCDETSCADTNTGGRYNPGTDSWTPTATANAPTGRDSHTAIWTGSEMVVWGGNVCDPNSCAETNTGGKYDPNTDSWTATAITDAPSARRQHAAVWTGAQMVVWGGGFTDQFYNFQHLNTGARYDPAADSWVATADISAPEARTSHTAVWTGTEMIIWGGFGADCNSPTTAGGR